MIIEKVARILDYFNKEKIVRIILMLFDVQSIYIIYYPSVEP